MRGGGFRPRSNGAFLKNISGLRMSQDFRPKGQAWGFLSPNQLSNNLAGKWDFLRKNQRGRRFGSSYQLKFNYEKNTFCRRRGGSAKGNGGRSGKSRV